MTIRAAHTLISSRTRVGPARQDPADLGPHRRSELNSVAREIGGPSEEGEAVAGLACPKSMLPSATILEIKLFILGSVGAGSRGQTQTQTRRISY
jgi:hypothetical protein